MTKDNAWKEFCKDFEEPYDAENIQDAFEWGWAQCMKEYNIKPDDKVPYLAILDATNEILDKKFKLTLNFKNHVKARWREGMRLDDFKNVCTVKKAQWDSDPAMRPFLRPETLFGNKMDGYNNEKAPRKETPDWM